MPEIANPYIAGSPVTGTEMFFGREDVFASIRQALSGQHRDHVLVLYGQRRTGKTSVLYQMSRHLDARYLCIFIDLHGLALDGLGGLLWELANHIARILRREYQINLPPLNRDEFLSDPRSSFEEKFLDSVWAAIGDRHLLLMLDEAIRLEEQVRVGKLEPAIFEYLRHLMQHYERLNFLFSLGSGLEEMEREYAFLFNVALYKKISFLTRPAAVALITEPVKNYYAVEPPAIDHILNITACHPYYTQLVCHSLFNRWQQTQSSMVRVSDVDAVLDEVVERGLAVLKHVWDESTPGEKAVLAGIAATQTETKRAVRGEEIERAWQKLDVIIPKGEMAVAIQNLIARDIIAGQDAYAFTVDLQRLWVQRYRRLEWVKEEISVALAEWVKKIVHAVLVESEKIASAPTVAASPPSSRRSPFIGILALAGILVIAILVGLVFWFANRSVPGITPSTGEIGGVIPGGETAQISDLALQANAVWAATEGGLVRWTADERARVFRGPDLGFDTNCIQTIVAAPDGTLWLGCGGVAHIRPNGDQITTLGYYNRDDGLGMGVVRALIVDTDGTIWAGGAPDANRPPPLSHFDGKAWHTDEPLMAALARVNVRVNINSLLRSRDGALWLGLHDDGVLRWDGRAWTHFGPEQGVGRGGNGDYRVRRLFQDANGTLWAAASDEGLLRFDAGQGRWNKIKVINDNARITAGGQSADGILGVAGDAMVAYSNDGGQTWNLLGTSEGLGKDIGGLVKDADGRVWAGAYSSGISYFNGDRWRALQR